jgi:hypothetical protein
MVLMGYRGRVMLRVFMAFALAGTIVLVIFMIWSRRPLIGIALAAGVLLYRVRLARQSLAVRGTVLAVALVGATTIGLYLTATRGTRFSEHGKALSGVFSREAFDSVMGGINCNFMCMEMTVARIPEENPYLYGSGLVPAFTFLVPRSIWESKPVASGYVTSQMWYRTNRPTNTIPNTIFGEMHMNFGVTGVFLGLLLCGAVVRGFNTYLQNNPRNLVVWSAWALVIPDFVGEWRGDFTSMTVQGLLRVSVFVLLAWLARYFVAHRDTGPALTMASVEPQPRGPRPPPLRNESWPGVSPAR